MFQRLALERLADAKALYASGNYSGSYYLAGYAVECALKAVLCRRLFQRHTLPERNALDKMYSHDLEQLLAHSGLKNNFDAQRRARVQLDNNWSTIKDWKETSRYRKNSKILARDLIRAIDTGPDSFRGWVETQW